jgi:glycine cleavage system H lipoate-binding protein
MSGSVSLLPFTQWELLITPKPHWVTLSTFNFQQLVKTSLKARFAGEVESTKSVSDIYAPVTGVIVEVNQSLSQSPETINSDPYGAGWLLKVEVSKDPDGLLSAAEYGEITA